MTRYRAVIELEAERWVDPNPGADPENGATPHDVALRIVAWVNDNGGEARYEPDHPWTEFGTPCVCNGGNEQQTSYPHRARLAIRRPNGWAYASPGEYIVMGITAFHSKDGSPWYHGTDECPRENDRKVVDFYACGELSELRLASGTDWVAQPGDVTL